MDIKDLEFTDRVVIAVAQAACTGKDLQKMGNGDKAAIAKTAYEIAKVMVDARRDFHGQHKPKAHL
jgi:hypothetical protein